MSDSNRAHLAALLTRASVLEAVRQRAAKANDHTAELAALIELDALRREYRAAESGSQSQKPPAG